MRNIIFKILSLFDEINAPILHTPNFWPEIYISNIYDEIRQKKVLLNKKRLFFLSFYT